MLFQFIYVFDKHIDFTLHFEGFRTCDKEEIIAS